MNKRKFLTILLVALLYVVSIAFSSMLAFHDDGVEERHHAMMVEKVYDSIEAKLMGALYVCRTMAGDVYAKELLKREKEGDTEEIAAYLGGLKETTGLSSLYLVSDTTRNYYTENGLERTIDPQKRSSDIWYQSFLDAHQPYTLDVAADPEQNSGWFVFIDAGIKDDEGELLGICGTRVLMSDLSKLFQRYEGIYGLKISLVDADGQVMVDSEGEYLGSDYHGGSIPTDRESEIYTKEEKGGYIATEYVAPLDWYLVVKSKDDSIFHKKGDFLLVVIVETLIFGAVAIFLVLLSSGRTVQGRGGSTGQTDALTGLLNRNYFKDVYGERGIFNTARYKAIAVFDIDYFKEANDSIDGDAVLRTVAELARETVGERGEIFRWGGDEFMMLMEWSVSFSYELCREFCRKVESDGKVTISVGVTEIRLSDTIKKNYYRAAQGCYLVKEMGGNGVKRC